MKSLAYILAQPGEGMRRTEHAVRKPQRGEVLVRTLATSVNFHDILNVQGVLPNLAWPRVPFSDNCCEIVEIGEDCGAWRLGDRVLANFFPLWIDGRPLRKYCETVFGDQIDGFLQQYNVVEARALVRAPTHLSAAEAASLCCAGLTAWRSVTVEARLQAGQVVVVQGTGGVSLFTLQIAKMIGAQVILLSSSEAKLDLGRKLGADHLINYRSDPGWDAQVIEITNGAGADLVVEIGGAETLQRSLNATAFGGHVAIVGVRSGFGINPPFPIEQVLISNLKLAGLTVGSVRELERLCEAVEAHRLRPVIDRSFAFDEAAAALALMDRQAHVGKIAIQVADAGPAER